MSKVMCVTSKDLAAREANIEVTMERGPLLIREWSAEEFHRRVLQLESSGYVARRDTYRITAEINPETGEIIHLYTIEMTSPAEIAVNPEQGR
jgi:hypothetical protein